MASFRRRGALALAVVVAAVLRGTAADAQAEKALDALRAGRYEEAERLATPLSSAKTPQGAEAALVLARVQLETGRYDGAAKTAVRARQSHGSVEARSHEVEGEALLRMGRAAEAIKTLEKVRGTTGMFRARVLLARAYGRGGNHLEERAIYESLADDYNNDAVPPTDAEGLAAIASAVHALEYFQDANDVFAESTRVDRTRVETQTEWARLYLEKYDAGHAEECLNDALKANPASAEAHVLMAKVRMQQGFEFLRAGEELDSALRTNPSMAEAYAFRATLSVRDRLWEEALQDIAKALSIDPADPYALSVKAATHYVADDRAAYEKTLALLRTSDPRYIGHVPVLTDLLEWEHRYEEIVDLNREALKVNSAYWEAHGAIGLNLLRLGNDDDGLAALRESWRNDRFNVLVFNTLNLYDDVIARDYVYVKRGPLRYRLHKNDQEIMLRYMPALLETEFNDLSRRYGHRPSDTTIELFADDDHFSRRSVGLPTAGVQGICFGKVVTAEGPRAIPLNWGQIVSHELAHVFSIQVSKSRVPRWFTEGLAVNEEGRLSKQFRREDDAVFYRWLKAGRMPAVASLNTAFSRAHSGAEINLAYYGSAKLTKFIEDRYGWPKTLEMLRLFGRGKREPEVVRAALGIEPQDLDRLFREEMLKQLSAYERNFELDYDWYYDREALEKAAKASPGNADAAARAAIAAISTGDKAAAEQYAAEALRLDPRQREAHHLLSDIGAATGNWKMAATHAEALLAGKVDGVGLRLNLATAAEKTGDAAGAAAQLKAAIALDPTRVEAHARLAKILLATGREAEALDHLTAAADLDQHDRGLYRELLRRLEKAGRFDLARRYGELSLYNDVLNPDLHAMLARAYERAGDRTKAIFEYESALLCEPREPAPIHLGLARALKDAGRREAALEHARKALELDPSSAPARAIVQQLGGGASPAPGKAP